MSEKTVSARDIVETFWGNDAPEWVHTLAQFCDTESQAAAARKIGRSPSLVNMVLKNKYTGDLKGVEKRVTSAFCSAPVPCPVLGEIDGATCLTHQRAPYVPTNPLAVRLYVSCRRCPFSLNCKKGEGNDRR